MPNEIDDLMDLDPLELTSTPGALEQIITYHRKARANAASGGKAKKEKGPSIDISEVMAGLVGSVPSAAPKIRRR